MGYLHIRPERVDMVDGSLELTTQPPENFVTDVKALYSFAEKLNSLGIRVLLMFILFSPTGPKFLLI